MDENNTFEVWSFKLSAIDKKIERINKRARKHGFAEIAYRIVSATADGFDPCGYRDQQHLIRNGVCARIIPAKRHEIEVDVNGAIRLEGWKLIATLESFLSVESGEKTTLVHAVPGEAVPFEFKDADFTRCDHCRKAIGRRQSFIVQREDEVRQIGKNCLADFLRTDPAQIVWMASLLKMARSISDEDRFEVGSFRSSVSSLDLLVEVAHVVRIDGDWYSSKDSRSTKTTAVRLMMPEAERPIGYEEKRELAEFARKYGAVTEADETQAIAWLRWIREQTGDSNEFVAKLRLTAVEKMWLSPKDFGIVAAMPVAMRTSEERAEREAQWAKEKAERESKKTLRAHVGTIGERMALAGTVTFTRETEGFYGTKTVIKIETAEKNLIVWFKSGYSELKVGDDVEGKATVSEHSDFNGELQTVVKRAALTAKEMA